MNSEVLAFFSRVIQKDENTLLQMIGVEGIEFPEQLLVFTVKGLYEFLRDGSPEDNSSYKSFRVTLYSGRINESLALQGHKIALYRSTGKVDTNWYKLVPLDGCSSPAL